MLQSDTLLCEAVHVEMQDISFPVFQALYFCNVAYERLDFQQIYLAHTQSSMTKSPVLSTPKPSHRRGSLTGLKRSQKQPRSLIGCTVDIDSHLWQSMSSSVFLRFLRNAQGMRDATKADADYYIREYERIWPTDFVSQDSVMEHISLRGFTRFLLCQECPTLLQPFPSCDMTKSLSNYFIASSHNTYLTGHQLHGESSANMYSLVTHLSAFFSFTATEIQHMLYVYRCCAQVAVAWSWTAGMERMMNQ